MCLAVLMSVIYKFCEIYHLHISNIGDFTDLVVSKLPLVPRTLVKINKVEPRITSSSREHDLSVMRTDL